jgi:hypothetical protein
MQGKPVFPIEARLFLADELRGVSRARLQNVHRTPPSQEGKATRLQ